MRVYGLTGGIASGKSTVAKILRSKGIPVVDADVVAREVVAPNSIGLKKIVDHFGEGILGDDGDLDRKKLGEIVPICFCLTWAVRPLHSRPAIGDVRENSTLNMATAHTLHLEILNVGYGYSILRFLLIAFVVVASTGLIFAEQT